MHNVASIYRFNTPFLNIKAEKDNLLGVLQEIKKILKFDSIYFQETKERVGDYYKVSLIFQEQLGKMEFYYISSLEIFEGEEKQYYLPVFKLDIFLNNNFLGNNAVRKKAVNFLTTIFESFDGMNEKEFLIDINSDFYYKDGFFKTRKYPHYDFSDIYKIQKVFESRGGMEVLENFITNFSDTHFILSKKTAKQYHKIHGIMLYFIYLVYIIYRNLEKTHSAKSILSTIETNESKLSENSGNIVLMKQRLEFVDDLNYVIFKCYRDKLDVFFKLF